MYKHTEKNICWWIITTAATFLHTHFLMSAHLSFDFATAAEVVITWAESLEDSVLALSHSVRQIQFSISFRNGNAVAATNLSEVVMR